jgi:hypothetical protein
MSRIGAESFLRKRIGKLRYRNEQAEKATTSVRIHSTADDPGSGFEAHNVLLASCAGDPSGFIESDLVKAPRVHFICFSFSINRMEISSSLRPSDGWSTDAALTGAAACIEASLIPDLRGSPSGKKIYVK